MNKIILLVATVILVGCFSVKTLTTPSQQDVDRVASKFPNYTLAQLNEGQALFQQKCTSCHKLKNPTAHNEKQWKKIVPKMVSKANKKTTVIDATTQDLILKYLVTMSNAKKNK